MPKEPCIRLGCTLTQPGEYDRMISVDLCGGGDAPVATISVATCSRQRLYTAVDRSASERFFFHSDMIDYMFKVFH